MKDNKFLFTAISCIFIFLIAVVLLNIKVFNFSNDGFYIQMMSASKMLHDGTHFNPLYYVHLERLFVFYPFYAAMGSNYESLFAGIAFIFYALPILFFSYKNRHAYSQLLFLLFPFVVSYRTTLGMCSIAYLFIVIFKKEKNYYLLSLSLLLANLSSGIVLSWLLCVLFNFKKILINHKKLVPVFIILFIGFIYSIISKFYYFFTAVAIKSTSGLLARSTIYVSYDQNQYGRLICYTILIIMLVTILTLILIRSGSSRNLLSFYASAIPAVFLEGLGLISYAICFLWFFVYVQPIVFKPREKPTIQPN